MRMVQNVSISGNKSELFIPIELCQPYPKNTKGYDITDIVIMTTGGHFEKGENSTYPSDTWLPSHKISKSEALDLAREYLANKQDLIKKIEEYHINE